jgi:hypothetical protein
MKSIFEGSPIWLFGSQSAKLMMFHFQEMPVFTVPGFFSKRRSYEEERRCEIRVGKGERLFRRGV